MDYPPDFTPTGELFHSSYRNFTSWALVHDWIHLVDWTKLKHGWLTPTGKVVEITEMDGIVTDVVAW